MASCGASNVSYVYATACRRPEGATNKDVEAARKSCSQRLAAEVDAVRQDRPAGELFWVLALGETAFKATTGKSGASDAWRGSPLVGELAATKVIATWDPYQIATPKGRRYAAVWVGHLDRYVKLATGQLPPFEWPEIVVDGGAVLEASLRAILDGARAGGTVSVDLETRGLGLDSAISCIGLASDRGACCIQLPPSVPNDLLVREILSCGVMLGQNLAAFDRRVLARAGYALTDKWEDTLIAASILDPQLDKNLGFLVNAEFHAEAHKAAFKTDRETGIQQGTWDSTDPEVERERREYCLKDAYTTLLLWHVQKRRLKEYGQHLYEDLKRLTLIALRMREQGCEWDFEAAAELDARYSEKLNKALEQIQKAGRLFGIPDLNPGSPKQLRELFYGKMKLAPEIWSDAGEPSTSEDALTGFLKSDNPAAVEMAKKVSEYREAQKALGTYVRGMAPDEGQTRIYGEWRAHTAISGRWSCTGRPLQTLSGEMRRLIKASPGKLMCEADLAAAELRTVALYANDPTMLQIFADGEDLYSIISRQIFNDLTIKKGHKLRQLGKMVCLASNYAASAETVWRQVVKDPTVQKEFPNLTVRQVEAVQKGYFKVCARIPLWWREEAEESSARGYYLCPYSGRRIHFYGPVDLNLMANMPNQSTVAKWMNDALLKVDAELQEGDTILTCVHDAITIESFDVERIQKLLHKHMEGVLRYKDREVAMPVESKIGKTLAEVK